MRKLLVGVLSVLAFPGCMQAATDEGGIAEESVGQIEQHYTNLGPCGGTACDQRTLVNTTAYSGGYTDECIERITTTNEARQWACTDSRGEQQLRINQKTGTSDQYEIKLTSSNLCLTYSGTAAVFAACDWNNNAKIWYLDNGANGDFQVRNVATNTCLKRNGSNDILASCAWPGGDWFRISHFRAGHSDWPVIDDNFGSYNGTIWQVGDGGWSDNRCRGGAAVGGDNNVVINGDGMAHLVIRKNDAGGSRSYHDQKDIGYKTCTFGELRTKNDYGPGWMEVRAKTPVANFGSGYIFGFFTYNFDGTGDPWGGKYNDAPGYKGKWKEWDQELLGSDDTHTLTSLITNNCNPDDYLYNSACEEFSGTYHQNRSNTLPFSYGHQGRWRIYGVRWDSANIWYYVDGIEVAYRNTSSDLSGWGWSAPSNLGAFHFPGGDSVALMMNFWLSTGGFGGSVNEEVWPDAGQRDDNKDVDIDWFRYWSHD